MRYLLSGKYNRLLMLFGTAIVMIGMMAGCDLLNVENPNTLVEEELSNPNSIEPLANGAEVTVLEAIGAVLAPQATVSDELKWVGSYDSWKQLETGKIDDPLNTELETAFAEVAEARWTAQEAVRRLEGFQSNGQLGNNREALVRSYLYAGVIHTWVADAFDNFVFSNKQEAGEPIGEENMDQVYDTAISFLDKGISLAQQMGDEEWETRLLAVRARTKYSKGLWSKLNPDVDTASPLVSHSGAVADAEEVLDRVADDWEFTFEVSSESSGATSRVGALVNNRRELRFGNSYIQPTSDNKGVESITLQDKIDNVVAPALVENINSILGEREFVDVKMATAREMHLILAEAALADNNGNNNNSFEQHINAIRDLDGLTSYTGQVPPLEMLIHSRRVNLYLQGRRLADQYRFDQSAPMWTGSVSPGEFFPISDTERRSNPNL